MDIATILSKMHETLKKSRSKRLTALRELQEEEDNPFKILIGTIISARTRDENSKVAVRRLFNKFRDPEALASASIDEIAELIKEAGFYRIKAKRIKEVAKIIHQKYNDEVPSNIDELLELPGVGRKTANCVLVYAFDKDAIPVDTHVHRIANRLGLVNTKEPEETEEELKKIIDRKYWKSINDTFVMFGQNVCKPIKPLCNECLLKDYCKYFNAS
ncbi:MAG: endonuclease III [Candidatus Nitrosocaldaceae archaeon]|nr:MAG: endonuclease III [Candidatus Nitrosocaldaceae archaeon]